MKAITKKKHKIHNIIRKAIFINYTKKIKFLYMLDFQTLDLMFDFYMVDLIC